MKYSLDHPTSIPCTGEVDGVMTLGVRRKRLKSVNTTKMISTG